MRGLGSQSAAKQRSDDRPMSRLRSSLGMTAAAALALAGAAVNPNPRRVRYYGDASVVGRWPEKAVGSSDFRRSRTGGRA